MGILKRLFSRKKKAEYELPFYIVEYTKPAMELGVKGDENKVILLYDSDENGDMTIKKYEYSPERIFSLENIRRIPGFDKTKEFPEPKLPVFSRIMPLEVEYSK